VIKNASWLVQSFCSHTVFEEQVNSKNKKNKSGRRKKIMRLSILLLLSVAVLASVITATEVMTSSEDDMRQQMHSHLRLEENTENGRDETSSRNLQDQQIALANLQAASSAIADNLEIISANVHLVVANPAELLYAQASINVMYEDLAALQTLIAGTGLRIPAFRPSDRAELKTAVKFWIDQREAAMVAFGHISEWDTSMVTDMSYLFELATAFNDDISSWDTGAVTDMSWMFFLASSFNQPLVSWDVSRVTRMQYMFYQATSFNQPLSSWDVNQVTNLYRMFYNALGYSYTLCWDLNVNANADQMLCNSDGSFGTSVASCALLGGVTVSNAQRAASRDCVW
jgi:surface protein